MSASTAAGILSPATVMYFRSMPNFLPAMLVLHSGSSAWSAPGSAAIESRNLWIVTFTTLSASAASVFRRRWASSRGGSGSGRTQSWPSAKSGPMRPGVTGSGGGAMTSPESRGGATGTGTTNSGVGSGSRRTGALGRPGAPGSARGSRYGISTARGPSANGGRTMSWSGRCGTTGGRPSTRDTRMTTAWKSTLAASATHGQRRRSRGKVRSSAGRERPTPHPLQHLAQAAGRLREPGRAHRERDPEVAFARRAEAAPRQDYHTGLFQGPPREHRGGHLLRQRHPQVHRRPGQFHGEARLPERLDPG